MARSDKKAKVILSSGGVFPLFRSPLKEVWGVEGRGGVYEVSVYLAVPHGENGYMACTCRNIRPVDCSHIKAVKVIRNGNIKTEQPL